MAPKIFKKKRIFRKKKTVARKALKPSKAFKKAVQSIIHKDAETKEAYHAFDLTAFNSGITTAADICRVIPNIQQGVDDNSRIGAELRVQKLSVKGHMILSTNNQSLANTRIGVRMIMCCPKAADTFTNVINTATTWLTGLLKKGGTSVAFTGLISDLYAPIDRDNVTVYYDKVFYLSLPYLNTVTSGGNTNLGSQVVSQELRQTVRFFTIYKKMVNRKLRYVDSIDVNQPQNFSPVIVLGYTHLDGSAPDVVSTQVSMAFDTRMDFEDV